MQFAGVAGRTCQAYNRVTLFGERIVEILVSRESDRQTIGVELRIGLTCKESESSKVILRRKRQARRQFEAGLFERHEPVVRKKPSALRRVIELLALIGRPVLLQVDDLAGRLI